MATALITAIVVTAETMVIAAIKATMAIMVKVIKHPIQAQTIRGNR
jgi:hypothetical protein